MTSYAKIIGTGSYLPPRRVTNHELVAQLAEKGIETSDEWIYTRSGISARHWAESNVTSSDLAVQAAERAIEMAGIDRQAIDLILVATSTPDYVFPSTACLVQQKLNLDNHCAAFDMQAVCAGFAYALAVADKFIRSGSHRNVLVIGTEVFSRLLDFNDRSTCVLFGDGAGAVLLSASQVPGILSSALHADGSYVDILCVAGNVARGGITGHPFLHMDGPAVFKLAVSVLSKVAREALDAADLPTTKLDWLIPHQANIRIMQSSAKKLGLALKQMVATVHEHGNTSAASIPLALDVAIRDGRIRAGHHVLMEGVGGGFTWGAVLLRM